MLHICAARFDVIGNLEKFLIFGVMSCLHLKQPFLSLSDPIEGCSRPALFSSS